MLRALVALTVALGASAFKPIPSIPAPAGRSAACAITSVSPAHTARQPGGAGFRGVRMGELKEASASVVVCAPIADVWKVWSNFELMPRWQPWISEVVVNEDATSKWTLTKKVLGVPLSFSWTAVELPRVEHKLIHWEATSGLENKGRVEFNEVPEGVDVKMTISYKLPSVLAFMFRGRKSRDEGGPVNAAVKKILVTDLRRFKKAMEESPQTFA